MKNVLLWNLCLFLVISFPLISQQSLNTVSGNKAADGATLNQALPPSGLYGDVNGDTEINIIDSLIIAQYYVGLEPEIDLTTADVNCDGVINIIDALQISQYYVGLLKNFSCTVTPVPTPAPTPVNVDDWSDNKCDFNYSSVPEMMQYWQYQFLWVNEEGQCYVPDDEDGGIYNVLDIINEGSDGKAVRIYCRNVGSLCPCTNPTKFGQIHPSTPVVAGRICTKNRFEKPLGKWSARIRFSHAAPPGFPAWWLLGNRNNEPPVQEADENVCWPISGSKEIDLFETQNWDGFTTRAVISNSGCNDADWATYNLHYSPADLMNWHVISVEINGSDLVFKRDGVIIHSYPVASHYKDEIFFGILNYATQISPVSNQPTVYMDVDWVKWEAVN